MLSFFFKSTRLNRNRLTDLEKELMITGGGEEGERQTGSLGWTRTHCYLKTGNQQGPAVRHKDLYSKFYDNLNWKRIWKRMCAVPNRVWHFVSSETRAHQAPLSSGIFQARNLEWVGISSSKGFFPTQELNLGLLYCRQILYHLSHQGSLWRLRLGSNSGSQSQQQSEGEWVDGKLPAGDLMVGGYLLTCLTGFMLKASQGLRHQGCRMRNFIRDQKLSAIKGGVETGRFFFFLRLDREGHGQVKVKV